MERRKRATGTRLEDTQAATSQRDTEASHPCVCIRAHTHIIHTHRAPDTHPCPTTDMQAHARPHPDQQATMVSPRDGSVPTVPTTQLLSRPSSPLVWRTDPYIPPFSSRPLLLPDQPSGFFSWPGCIPARIPPFCPSLRCLLPLPASACPPPSSGLSAPSPQALSSTLSPSSSCLSPFVPEET